MPIVLKSVSLNLLEPSGSVQACNGIALLLACHNCRSCSWCSSNVICLLGSTSMCRASAAVRFNKICRSYHTIHNYIKITISGRNKQCRNTWGGRVKVRWVLQTHHHHHIVWMAIRYTSTYPLYTPHSRNLSHNFINILYYNIYFNL